MTLKSNENKAEKWLIVCINMFFSFLLSLFVVVLSLLIVLQVTVRSPKFMMQSIDDSKYIENIKLDIEEQFISYGMSSGFDEEFFVSVLDDEQLHYDILDAVDYIHDKSMPGVDIESFRVHILNELRSNAISRGYEIDDHAEEGLQYLAEICAKAYGDFVGMGLVRTAWHMFLPYMEYITAAIVVVGILTLISAGMLVLMNRKEYLFARYFIYSFSGAVLTLVVPVVMIFSTNIIERFGISSPGLAALFVDYANDVVFAIVVAILVIAVLAIASIVLRVVVKRSETILVPTHGSNYDSLIVDVNLSEK